MIHAIKLIAVFVLLPALIWAQNTPEADNLVRGTADPGFHADIPFLSQSKHKIWYIYLVICIVGLAFLCSVAVVIMGLVRWERRKRLLEKKAKKADIENPEEVLHKGMNVEEAINVKHHGVPVKLDLLFYKPGQDDDVRFRELQIGHEEELRLERKRRTAQHENLLHTLHQLRRLNSS